MASREEHLARSSSRVADSDSFEQQQQQQQQDETEQHQNQQQKQQFMSCFSYHKSSKRHWPHWPKSPSHIMSTLLLDLHLRSGDHQSSPVHYKSRPRRRHSQVRTDFFSGPLVAGKNTDRDEAEPVSPKVTCMGRITMPKHCKHKTKATKHEEAAGIDLRLFGGVVSPDRTAAIDLRRFGGGVPPDRTAAMGRQWTAPLDHVPDRTAAMARHWTAPLDRTAEVDLHVADRTACGSTAPPTREVCIWKRRSAPEPLRLLV